MDNLNFACIGINMNNKGKPDEIATPLNICNDMVELFPSESFNDNNKIWADIYCKTGNTLKALKQHGVQKENIIAICPTPQSQLFACRQLYGKLLEEIEIDKDKYSEVTGTFKITRRGQVYYISNWKEMVTGKINNTNAFEIITKIILKEMGAEMKTREFTSENEFSINNIIMNPPYNSGMDLDFVNLAYKIATDNVIAITPAKWQTAEANQRVTSKMSYGEFREEIVPHMKQVCFYPCCKDIFDILQVDGITYYIIDKNNTYEKCEVKNICKYIKEFNGISTRDIRYRQSLVNIGNEIIEYLGEYKRFHFKDNYYNKKFQVWTNTQAPGGNLSTIVSIRKTLFIGESNIEEDIGINVQRSTAEICSFTSDSKMECESFVSWLNCKFTRFFTAINQSKLTGIMTDDCFRFVPAPSSDKFDHIYTDQELYKAFNLPQKYIDIIESVIKERK